MSNMSLLRQAEILEEIIAYEEDFIKNSLAVSDGRRRKLQDTKEALYRVRTELGMSGDSK